MATWDRVSGAKGYLLDVSTTNSFTTYLDGYRELDIGDVAGRLVTGLNRGTTYYYRVRPYNAAGAGNYSVVKTATTVPTVGLVIHPTFDSSITNNPNAAAIQATINRAISYHESLFADPITVQIRFRYSTTTPDGHPLPMGTLAQTEFVIYPIPWSTYIGALRADALSGNDSQANASLPGTALSGNITPSSADGRAVGLDTPPAMFANGNVGQGGPYDAIVTLNSAPPFQFNRPPSPGNFDAQRSIEHEVDEAIGLGSRLGGNGNDLRPQDLFSWSSPGNRNISSSGTRYFSINGGVNNVVNFNQNPDGDLGDWFSEQCPQTHPYVQNAFGCAGQYSDISATSPEGINLDVIGYDLAQPQTGPPRLGNISTRSFVQTG
ncbi:MAG TPA: fibronectin type III domain-containing protein, partial [Candidatus Udaeobacter sp.]|nr:fibronectin type III domain-containing protein [Candidatus Udaeobacter sp.]